jgi:4-diphosphocytidyl-2-C-methyl-D-erythritol kinase
MRSVTVRAPAKINLQLSVGVRRDDGYHDVMTVFQAVSLHDDVTAAPARRLGLTVAGDDCAGVPLDETNLAARAVIAIADRAGLSPDVHLHLRKGIPVAGGMAGGSADAAAALVACDALWGLRLDRAELLDVAAQLGSDVPFALVGGTAIGLGRGERLTSALARGTYHWVFAFADAGLSTAGVYAELDRLRDTRSLVAPARLEISEPLMSALRAGDAVALAGALVNDMQAAACSLRPQLRLTLDVGREYGALGAIVSGSGPTCAFLVRDQEQALDLAVALSASGVCRSVRRGHGPVPGARVLED